MRSLLCVSVALFLNAVVDAFAAWQPNCTLSTKHVNYVSGPQVRGTMEIIWTCFTVLSLCTWTVQHLMVPVHKENNKVPAIRKFWGKVSFNYTKLKWMGWCIAAPEYILGKALTEFLAAHDSRRQFKEWFATNDTGRSFDYKRAHNLEQPLEEVWTTAHGFFANMRGFVLRFNVAAVPTSLEASKPTELGRSRQNPRLVNRDGDPPYYEQEIKKAEATELAHCRNVCGVPCRNRPDVPSSEIFGIPADPLPCPRYQPVEPANTGQANDDIEVTEKPKRAVMEMETHKKPEPLKLPTDRVPLQDLSPTEATAVTLVDSPNFLQHNIVTALVPSTFAIGPVTPMQKLGPHKVWQGCWALSSIQLLYACQKGIIPGPPELSTSDLEDRSKGDVFIKGAAILQLTWLVIQMIARASEGLAITLLEITTLAYAACAIATYVLLWHKPQDVMTPTYFDSSKLLTREHVIGLAARSPVSTLSVKEFWLHGVAVRAMADTIFPWTRGIPIRLPRQHTDVFYLNPVFIGIGFGGVLFGSVHFIAWNFEFPTPVERILWRLSCGVAISLPLLGTLMYFVTVHNARRDSESDIETNALLKPFMWICTLLYLFARLYLMVEVFRSLASAPPSTFQEINWPSAIPHVN